VAHLKGGGAKVAVASGGRGGKKVLCIISYAPNIIKIKYLVE